MIKRTKWFLFVKPWVSKTICTKFGWNWPNDSGEGNSNRKSLHTHKDRRTDVWRAIRRDYLSVQLRWAKKHRQLKHYCRINCPGHRAHDSKQCGKEVYTQNMLLYFLQLSTHINNTIIDTIYWPDIDWHTESQRDRYILQHTLLYTNIRKKS